jgi:DNA-binding Lrp family transcriptional regulator
VSVSDFELNILEILKEDARTAPERIAVMTGSDADTVRAPFPAWKSGASSSNTPP